MSWPNSGTWTKKGADYLPQILSSVMKAINQRKLYTFRTEVNWALPAGGTAKYPTASQLSGTNAGINSEWMKTTLESIDSLGGAMSSVTYSKWGMQSTSNPTASPSECWTFSTLCNHVCGSNTPPRPIHAFNLNWWNCIREMLDHLLYPCFIPVFEITSENIITYSDGEYSYYHKLGDITYPTDPIPLAKEAWFGAPSGMSIYPNTNAFFNISLLVGDALHIVDLPGDSYYTNSGSVGCHINNPLDFKCVINGDDSPASGIFGAGSITVNKGEMPTFSGRKAATDISVTLEVGGIEENFIPQSTEAEETYLLNSTPSTGSFTINYTLVEDNTFPTRGEGPVISPPNYWQMPEQTIWDSTESLGGDSCSKIYPVSAWFTMNQSSLYEDQA